METVFIEAAHAEPGNWGKFMVARFAPEEWSRRSQLPDAEGQFLLVGRGWSTRHVLVVDLQTGEGAIFMPHGIAAADLNKHRIWVCPMFEPFLEWLYRQDLTDLQALDRYVELEAPFAVSGYRRTGPTA